MLAQALAEDGAVAFHPAWATVCVLVAVFFVALDRYSGVTRGWIRAVRAFQELSCELEAFRIDYEHSRLEWDAERPTRKQVDAHVSSCRQFLMRVHEVVRQETEQWAGDFETVLRQFDRMEDRGFERS